MRVLFVQSNVLDLDEVASTSVGVSGVVVTFRNGNQINLDWRDKSERTAILDALELSDMGGEPKNHAV